MGRPYGRAAALPSGARTNFAAAAPPSGGGRSRPTGGCARAIPAVASGHVPSPARGPAARRAARGRDRRGARRLDAHHRRPRHQRGRRDRRGCRTDLPPPRAGGELRRAVRDRGGLDRDRLRLGAGPVRRVHRHPRRGLRPRPARARPPSADRVRQRAGDPRGARRLRLGARLHRRGRHGTGVDLPRGRVRCGRRGAAAGTARGRVRRPARPRGRDRRARADRARAARRDRPRRQRHGRAGAGRGARARGRAARGAGGAGGDRGHRPRGGRRDAPAARRAAPERRGDGVRAAAVAGRARRAGDAVREAGLPVELEIVGDPVAAAAGRRPQRVPDRAGGADERAQARRRRRGRASSSATRADAVELEVSDDGAGAPTLRGRRHGLVGMRERVALYGGDLQAGRRARRAAGRVRARLPLGAA